MDQLKAYKVLEIEPGASPEEIKEAYVTLSKKFHPEEEPEKFQEIHEAYTTLARRNRRRAGTTQTVRSEEQRRDADPIIVQENQEEYDFNPKSSGPQEEPGKASDDSDQQLNFDDIKPEPKQARAGEQPVILEEKKQDFDFHTVESHKESAKAPEYAFDDAMKKAEKKEQQDKHELVLEAAAELKLLTSPKYQNKLKAFKAFFQDEKYATIIKTAEFLEKLCDVLEERELKKSFYNYLIDFYRLRGRKQSDLSAIGLRLYRILDEKTGIKAQVSPGIYGGAFAGILAVYRVLRPIIRTNDIASALFLAFTVVLIFVWMFRKLCVNHSVWFAQGVTAAAVMASQFLVIVFDMYGTTFGTVDDGNLIAALILLGAGVWLAVVLVVSLFRALFRSRK